MFERCIACAHRDGCDLRRGGTARRPHSNVFAFDASKCRCRRQDHLYCFRHADDCWIEDPIGSELKKGRDTIREFYAGIAAMEVDPRMTRIGPVTVCGGEAAFQFRIDIEIGELKIKMTSTDVMTFDAAGKITSMRAFADGEADPDA